MPWQGRLYLFLSLSQSTMQSWINSSLQTISETSHPETFSLFNKRRKWFWVQNFYVIVSIISLRNSQVSKHMPTLLRSPSSAGQGPWQHQRAVSHRCGGPDTMVRNHSALYWWEASAQGCRTIFKWSPGQTTKPFGYCSCPPWVFASLQSGRAPPRSSALLPRGGRLSMGCEARRACNLIVKNAKHFWILLDEWQINDNSEVINWLT